MDEVSVAITWLWLLQVNVHRAVIPQLSTSVHSKGEWVRKGVHHQCTCVNTAIRCTLKPETWRYIDPTARLETEPTAWLETDPTTWLETDPTGWLEKVTDIERDLTGFFDTIKPVRKPAVRGRALFCAQVGQRVLVSWKTILNTHQKRRHGCQGCVDWKCHFRTTEWRVHAGMLLLSALAEWQQVKSCWSPFKSTNNLWVLEKGDFVLTYFTKISFNSEWLGR